MDPKKTKAAPQREGSFQISYRWSCDSFPKGIPDELWEALKESAQEQALILAYHDGSCEGELLDYVNMTIPKTKTPEDGFVCRGWFTITEN